MKKITKYFKYSYENDTTIEYVNTGLYSMLSCSFTSEDPDYGTDTIHYAAYPVKSMEQIAYEMLAEVKDFMDYRDGDIAEPRKDVKVDYEEYSNSTLIAIEWALQEITKDYCPKKWYATIREAAEKIAKRLLEDRTVEFAFCESDHEEAKRNPEEHEENGGWFGIKRIDGFFQNNEDEFIIAVGYWGGGNVAFGYVEFGKDEEDRCEYVVRKAIMDALGFDADDYIYIEEEEKKHE